jgi:adenylosuccinate synthase
MPVTVVVGGQYGSEGKGKAAVRLMQESYRQGSPVVSVRCGGPNAGHTVYLVHSDPGSKRVLRHIPSGVAIPGADLVIAAGSLIDVDLLLAEIRDIEATGIPVSDRLRIDSQAAIVSHPEIDFERLSGLRERIGSTCTGTGQAAMSRCARTSKLVSEDARLARYIKSGSVSKYLSWRKERSHVVIEGTQGFGLSLWNSGNYPFCTSKDTTAMAFMSDAGVPQPANVCMVIRTYPIRVGGNSGPLESEITWKQIQTKCGAPIPLKELTSVTKRVRRVAAFTWDIVDQAFIANAPTYIAVHGMDYVNWEDRDVTSEARLSSVSTLFLRSIQLRYSVPVLMAFTGPAQESMVWFGSDGVQ